MDRTVIFFRIVFYDCAPLKETIAVSLRAPTGYFRNKKKACVIIKTETVKKNNLTSLLFNCF